MNKKSIKSLVIAVLVLAAVFGFVRYHQVQNKWRVENNLARSWVVSGEIISYEKTDDGLLVKVGSPRSGMVFIDDNTYIPDPELKERIENQETGLKVNIEAYYWKQTYGGVYNALYIRGKSQ